MAIWDKTYSLAENAPPPMSWDEYENIVRSKWDALLAESESTPESAVQAFLEKHPCMLPGPFGPIGGSGHSPYPAAIVTQPKLTDFNCKIPDFMWIARDSMSIYPILVEIEAPGKRWFTNKGVQHADLTQAINQLAEWKAWFANPRNSMAFADHYGIDLGFRNLSPKFMLIYGRRREANSDKEFAAKRHALVGADQTFMTFDRLYPQHGAREYITVQKKSKGYKAICIPPTLTLGPLLADERADIAGKEDALADSPYISEERKIFLRDRFSYWDTWHNSGAPRFMCTGDWE